jgi:multidrug resistance efflux pump
VAKGEVIATLDTRKMELDALRYRSQQAEALLKQRDEQGKHDIAAAEVQGARAAEAGAQLALERDRIARARLVAPYAGVIVSGDLSQQLGAPVERGKLLFELAPLDRYRVVVQVDEHDLRFVQPGQRASLVLSGLPGRTLGFTVSRVVPVALAEGGQNNFRVEGILPAGDPRLRPGMEGIGKIGIGEAKRAWIWSRPILDWMRLFWWRWWP